jgi:hypothetical protein
LISRFSSLRLFEAWVLLAAVGVCDAAPPARGTNVKECVAAAENGQRLRESRNLRDARAAFSSCTQASCPSVVRAQCAEWLSDVSERIPSIVARATDGQGKDLTDVVVYADGTLVQHQLDGRRVEIDPGQHVLRFVRKGSRPFETKVVVREGEKNRLVDVVLEAATEGSPDAAGKNPTSTTPTGGDTPTQERPFPVVPVVLGGVGLLGIGTFSFFAATGQSDLNDLRSSCAPHCAQGDVDAAHTKIIVANVALGVGVVALAVAAVLYFTQGPSAQSQASRTRGAPYRP